MFNDAVAAARESFLRITVVLNFRNYWVRGVKLTLSNITVAPLPNANAAITGRVNQPASPPGRSYLGLPPSIEHIRRKSYTVANIGQPFVINENGAFFNSSTDLGRMGGYAGASLASRVLQLLHDVGHLQVDQSNHCTSRWFRGAGLPSAAGLRQYRGS